MHFIKERMNILISFIVSICAPVIISLLINGRSGIRIAAWMGTLFLILGLFPVSFLALAAKAKNLYLQKQLKDLESSRIIFIISFALCFVIHAILAHFYILDQNLNNLGRIEIFAGLLSLVIAVSVVIFLHPRLVKKSGRYHKYIRQSIYIILPLGLLHSQLSKISFSNTYSLLGFFGLGLLLLTIIGKSIISQKINKLKIGFVFLGVLISLGIVSVISGGAGGLGLSPIKQIKGTEQSKKEFVETFVDETTEADRLEKSRFIFSQSALKEFEGSDIITPLPPTPSSVSQRNSSIGNSSSVAIQSSQASETSTASSVQFSNQSQTQQQSEQAVNSEQSSQN